MQKIKNIAIIAHVDHGKTTMVDALLRQTGAFRENQQIDERVMDSNELEKERGITIFSKNASLFYKGYKINIVDTPGHADFGGEVQRIMKMVDSVLLLVDAFEGPMPQTKYVLKKSLEIGLRPIVVINKVDRPNCRPDEVLNMIFDLFVQLNATNEQLDFPVIYASAKEGFARKELSDTNTDITPLFDCILEHVDDPAGDVNKPFQFLTSAIEYDNYMGRLGTGKIYNGKVAYGDEVLLLKGDGSSVPYRVSRLYSYSGLKRIEIKEALAGDIVSLAGLGNIDIGETVADREHPVPLPLISIDEPTLAMTFLPNTSPFMGKDGCFVTSTALWDRLLKEKEANVSLVIEKSEVSESFTVKGRGELQLSILIEEMRRERYEFSVSRPEVIYREQGGRKTEPIELATIDVADEFTGTVIEKMGLRKGEMLDMAVGTDGYTRLEFKIPSRGLIGFRNEFLTDTKGTGIINHVFYEYGDYRGDIPARNRGALVQVEKGVATAYALDTLSDRGELFITPGTEVYSGMIIGANSRENDMDVNVCRTKKLSNTRAAGSDEAVKLSPPKLFSLEQALEYIGDDELLEVTPKHIRMRKKILDPTERKKSRNKD